MVSHCGLDLHFPEDECWASSQVLTDYVYFVFRKCLFGSMAYFLNGKLRAALYELLIYFRYLPYIRYTVCNIFFTFRWLPFHLVGCFFYSAKVLV